MIADHNFQNSLTNTYQEMSKSPDRQRSVTSASTGSSDSSGKSRSSSAKPVNIFFSDGSFLDRIRHSMENEDDKKKSQQILERKKNFADRFKQRRKRSHPTVEILSGTSGTGSQGPSSRLETPQKKRQKIEAKPTSATQDENTKDSKGEQEKEKKDVSTEDKKEEAKSAQADYREAIASYPTSLKDSGTGVRPLIK